MFFLRKRKPLAGGSGGRDGRHAAPRAGSGAGRVVVLLVVAAGVLTIGPAAANASLFLDPAPPITPGDPAYQEVRHKCLIVGQAGTAQAVHCADVFTHTTNQFSGTDVYVQNEVMCQRTAPPSEGSLIACSGIKEQVAAGSPLGTASIPAQICGGILGHSPCTSGRDMHAAFAFNYLAGGNVECSIWGESVRDTVILPVTGHPSFTALLVHTNPFNVFSQTSREGYCQTP